jgi:farnesyl-diphosphate farnesyltransferase
MAPTPPLLDHFLRTCSRTFALTIPMLREPTRCQVTAAYLLFRVADTIEDATAWPAARKVAELERLAGFFAAPSDAAATTLAHEWMTEPPLEHAGYRELLAKFPAVMQVAAGLSPAAWRLIAKHTARTCRAMAAFVARERDGKVVLADLEELAAYCYAVAGIVGEMLTELFLLEHRTLRPIAARLRREARTFGEALQLVNILRDSDADAAEGRHYLGTATLRQAAFPVARRDLRTAAGYCARLERIGADRGLVAFTALPILLAGATLDRVERHGAGAKLARTEVVRIVASLRKALTRGAVADLVASGGSAEG